jgi:hypothetical protein
MRSIRRRIECKFLQTDLYDGTEGQLGCFDEEYKPKRSCSKLVLFFVLPFSPYYAFCRKYWLYTFTTLINTDIAFYLFS